MADCPLPGEYSGSNLNRKKDFIVALLFQKRR